MRPKDPISKAQGLPAGAVFRRCALQVNPQPYGAFRGQEAGGDARSHARSMVEKAAEIGVSVLVITDHNDWSGVSAFQDAAHRRDMHVFPGFELYSSEGVHVLCIYPQDTDGERLGRFLGEFGIRELGLSSKPSHKTFVEILRRAREQGGVTIAAHVTNEKGLFKVLSGEPWIRAWRNEDLLAIQIPGSVEDLPPATRSIVRNKNIDYRRAHMAEEGLAVAVLNARIESLRCVLGLDPTGEEAGKAHQGIVRHVLRSGTKISLLVRSYSPAKQEYRIDRIIPNPPVVRDENRQASTLRPDEVVAGVELYGQHEIAETTQSPEKLTHLLDRFVEHDESMDRRKAEIRREVQKTKRSLVEVHSDLQQIESRLAALPGLEETLKRFQGAGLEDRLREQSLLVREQRVLDSIPDRLRPFHECLESIRQELPIGQAFLSPKALDGLPGKEILAGATEVLDRLSHDLEQAAKQVEDSLARAEGALGEVRSRWDDRKQRVQTDYQKILRDLRKAAVDAEEFIRLLSRIEGLRPLRARQAALRRMEDDTQERRRSLLDEWEDLKAQEFRLLARTAKKVSHKLKRRAQVDVTAAGEREPLFRVFKEDIGGRLSEAIQAIRGIEEFSLPQFVNCCRSGAAAIQKRYAIPPAQAERLARAPAAALMSIEELELPPITVIRLNTAPADEPPAWQALKDLSKGQKATAVLLLLLLESDAPLIVDQPEDDINNRFIADDVVPRMREEKRGRQFLFSTHNANIPVIGDAELIVGLDASGEAETGKARIRSYHRHAFSAGAGRGEPRRRQGSVRAATPEVRILRCE